MSHNDKGSEVPLTNCEDESEARLSNSEKESVLTSSSSETGPETMLSLVRTVRGAAG